MRWGSGGLAPPAHMSQECPTGPRGVPGPPVWLHSSITGCGFVPSAGCRILQGFVTMGQGGWDRKAWLWPQGHYTEALGGQLNSRGSGWWSLGVVIDVMMGWPPSSLIVRWWLGSTCLKTLECCCPACQGQRAVSHTSLSLFLFWGLLPCV